MHGRHLQQDWCKAGQQVVNRMRYRIHHGMSGITQCDLSSAFHIASERARGHRLAVHLQAKHYSYASCVQKVQRCSRGESSLRRPSRSANMKDGALLSVVSRREKDLCSPDASEAGRTSSMPPACRHTITTLSSVDETWGQCDWTHQACALSHLRSCAPLRPQAPPLLARWSTCHS